jgi:hypothetical protein
MSFGKALLVDTRSHRYVLRVWDERDGDAVAWEEHIVPWTSDYGVAETNALALLNSPERAGIPEQTLPAGLLQRDEVQVLMADADESTAA